MPAFYEAPVLAFLAHAEDLIIGRQSAGTTQALTSLTAEQLESWRVQVRLLRSALRRSLAENWHIVLEYPIPRRGKRIDAVLLTPTVILVLEFKCGSQKYSHEARVQVEDYCLDLRDFHQLSRNRVLVPILVATNGAPPLAPDADVSDWVAPVWCANTESLSSVIERASSIYDDLHTGTSPVSEWAAAEYHPTPTIIEAARVLYEGQSVREISRCHAGAENLTRTSEAVISAIQHARTEHQKTICFVTGVPGAGKTLAGLNIVHNRELHDGSLGVFLSGNGPLVRVLSEALARDHVLRTPDTGRRSRRLVPTLVQNVHRFIDAHFATATPPPDRVVVFDEAQRAWNREQSDRKFKRDRSEPEIMLEVMDRHHGWAAIVALVGSGQEINTGEAGLREWGRALLDGFRHWRVFVSPHACAADPELGADLLFETRPAGIEITEDSALHLSVSQRSYKAEAVSAFVTNLLALDSGSARAALVSCSDFPILLTRDLQCARVWLRAKQRGSRRTGLIASSGGRRLRALGLDVRTELDVENWFLNDPHDTRSSYYLETPATEFGIQGLELDWTGLCWDIDFVPDTTDWSIRAFKGTRWQAVRDATRRQYAINKYRVLLTRAREGMIICVPRGDPADWTRPPAEYDAIAAYLRSCGIPEI